MNIFNVYQASIKDFKLLNVQHTYQEFTESYELHNYVPC